MTGWIGRVQSTDATDGEPSAVMKSSSGTPARDVACLWKVTEKDDAVVVVKKELPGNAVANTMVFYNDTIYVAGALVDASSGAKSACYWTVGKDGTVARHALDGVEATSVTVDMVKDSGGVYFGGYYLYEGTVKEACWWQLGGGSATRYDLMDDDHEHLGRLCPFYYHYPL